METYEITILHYMLYLYKSISPVEYLISFSDFLLQVPKAEQIFIPNERNAKWQNYSSAHKQIVHQISLIFISRNICLLIRCHLVKSQFITINNY